MLQCVCVCVCASVWLSELIYWPGQSRSRVWAITQSELLGPQIFANENGAWPVGVKGA